MSIKIIADKKLLNEQIRNLHRRGGQYQKAAEKIKSIMYDIQTGVKEPFKSLNVTNHGESRIKHCVKYDLNGFCRLITIKDANLCALVFAGDHDACDKWLNSNRGYTLTIGQNYDIIGLRVSEDVSNKEHKTIVNSVITDGYLISKLKDQDKYISVIEENINVSVFKKISNLDSFSEEDEILDAVDGIQDASFQDMIFDVLLYLKEDDVDRAKSRILLYENDIIKVSDANALETSRITSGEEFIVIDDFVDRDFKKIIESNNWLDWMLFMHPQQKKVVDQDFNGPARLLGVSGSGKTCVVVNRAIRLARKYSSDKILITTLNRSLAKLITDLINKAIDAEADRSKLMACIEVKSFWDLCRDLILKHSKQKDLNKYLSDITFKTTEDVEEIWQEYYQCREKNDDAKILLDVHYSLLSRNIFPNQYLKQEFDYIRSALKKNERKEYLNMEREGRSEPFSENYRKQILTGLAHWEDKMKFVGVCDYLGLLDPLHEILHDLKPVYRCILVDELQDFGTTELEILRKLVDYKENDIFLCGDIAQQVLTKQHKITKAGIIPSNYLSITKNYRNSRQILEAASNVFHNNIDETQYNQNGFKLLNPEFANFSTPLPFVRKSSTLKKEIENSFNYLKSNLSDINKGCIVIANLSYFEVKYLGAGMHLPVLDGDHDLSSGSIFLSDLEQTKGFEFDIVVIVNCSLNHFPNPKLPENEKYREISKLYVSMTRAKKELIISYSDKLSPVFQNSLSYFNCLTTWEDYIIDDNGYDIEIPISSSKTVFNKNENYHSLRGDEFLYQPIAVGLSIPAQQKIMNLIKGNKSTAHNGLPDGWVSLREFKSDLMSNSLKPHMNRLLGPKVFAELQEILSTL